MKKQNKRLRIVAGSLGGQMLELPDVAEVRPTTERSREAIFNILQNRVCWEESRVLDLFAGSGALGIEAISRGAGGVTFVEQNRVLARALERNLERLKISAAQVLAQDVQKALSTIAARSEFSQFEVVFIDPPYAKHPGDEVVRRLLDSNLVSETAFIVVESDQATEMSENLESEDGGLAVNCIETRKYGDNVFRIYQVLQ